MALITFPGGENYEDNCRASEAVSDNDEIILAHSIFKMKSRISALTLTWVFDDITIKSISGYSEQDEIRDEAEYGATGITVTENGYRAVEIMYEMGGLEYGGEDRDQFSQELQLLGNAFDDRLSYTIGIFYAEENMNNTHFSQLIGPKSFAAVGLVSLHKFFGSFSDLETETLAVFSQASLDVTDWFELTVGGRFTKEERLRDLTTAAVDIEGFANSIDREYVDTQLFEGVQFLSSADFDSFAASTTSLPLKVGDTEIKGKSWEEFTPSITASFMPGDETLEDYRLSSMLVYLTYSEGFKAGGFAPKGSELLPFEPEEVDNIEMGVKIDSVDKRIRFNAAIYHMDYTNIQLRVAETGERISDVFLYMTNAGEATIEGLETELTWLATNSLVISAQASYTDASFDEFLVTGVKVLGMPAEEIDRSKEDFSNVPDTTFGIDISYMIHSSQGLFIPRINGYYRSEVYTGNDYLSPAYEKSTLDSLTLFNARLSWQPSEDFDATLYINNVTDKNYFAGGTSIPTTMGSSIQLKGQPRTYGIELRYRI